MFSFSIILLAFAILLFHSIVTIRSQVLGDDASQHESNGLTVTPIPGILFYDNSEDIQFPLPNRPFVPKLAETLECDSVKYKMCHELVHLQDIVQATHDHQLGLEVNLREMQIHLWQQNQNPSWDELPSKTPMPSPAETLLCSTKDCSITVDHVLAEVRRVKEKLSTTWADIQYRMVLTGGRHDVVMERDNFIQERKLVNSLLSKLLDDIQREIQFNGAFNKYSSTLVSCQNRELSESTIGLGLLHKRLAQVEDDLQKRNFSLAISPPETGKYYESEGLLVRCHFENPDWGVLTLGLPVAKKGPGIGYHLKNIVASPNTNPGGSYSSCRISERVVVEESSGAVILLDNESMDKCVRRKLCKVPEVSKANPTNMFKKKAECLSKLIRGDIVFVPFGSSNFVDTACSVFCTHKY